ncbi:hypothetical protein CJ739_3410 [Mariniflexile rhizosphaerae]|nr:hypothetical protein CJ739_3410 [Mariniflexile sp. TRM1-10]
MPTFKSKQQTTPSPFLREGGFDFPKRNQRRKGKTTFTKQNPQPACQFECAAYREPYLKVNKPEVKSYELRVRPRPKTQDTRPNQ